MIVACSIEVDDKVRASSDYNRLDWLILIFDRLINP